MKAGEWPLINVKEVLCGISEFDSKDFFKSLLKAKQSESDNSVKYDNALKRLLEKDKRDKEIDEILKRISILHDGTDNNNQLTYVQLVSQIVQITQGFIESNHLVFERVIKESSDPSTVTSQLVLLIVPYVSAKLSGVGSTIIITTVTAYLYLYFLKFNFEDNKQEKLEREIITQVFDSTQIYIDTYHPNLVEFIEENPETSKLSSLILVSVAPYVADKVSGIGLSIIVAFITIYINLIVLRFIDPPKNDKEDDK